MQTNTSINNNNKNNDETSPESAALIRGAASTTKSVAKATRGTMVGRLPSMASASSSSRGAASTVSTATAKSASRSVVSKGVVMKTASRAPRPSSTAMTRGAPRSSATVRIPRTPSPKLSARIPKGRATTIAKASDRVSTTWDVYTAGIEGGGGNESAGDTTSTTKRQQRRAEKWSRNIPSLNQMASVGRVFVINAVLGMAVFATYEGMIDYLAPPFSKREEVDETDAPLFAENEPTVYDATIIDTANIELEHHTPQDAVNDKDESDAMDRASIPQHLLAGGLGGAAHAILSLAMELKGTVATKNSSGLTMPMNSNSLRVQIPKRINSMMSYNAKCLPSTASVLSLQYPTMRYSLASIAHHSLAHSALFGSYQFTKRRLLQYSLDFEDTNTDSTNATSMSSSFSIKDMAHASIIATAGGIAGQLQHITSHFTEQWLGLGGSGVKTSFRLATLPSLRSTLVAFPPSAIGFLAFEYGKLMVTGDEDTSD